MHINQYRTSIEISRATASREALKRLDKTFKNDYITNISYMGYSGRTFFFGFPTQPALDTFKLGIAQMLDKIQLKYEIKQ